jgi:hypothetical protein
LTPVKPWRRQNGSGIGALQVNLNYARSNDKFAFVFVEAGGAANGFLSSKEMKGYLGKLRSARPAATDSGARIYDALLAGANLLNPPQFGDVVILDGRLADSGSKTTVNDLVKLFLKNRTRFIGLSQSLVQGVPSRFRSAKIASARHSGA